MEARGRDGGQRAGETEPGDGLAQLTEAEGPRVHRVVDTAEPAFEGLGRPHDAPEALAHDESEGGETAPDRDVLAGGPDAEIGPQAGAEGWAPDRPETGQDQRGATPQQGRPEESVHRSKIRGSSGNRRKRPAQTQQPATRHVATRPTA